MTPIKIAIQGFGPFQKPAELKFPTGPSLNQLSGENLIDPQLGPNGVGKSKLFDALCWVQYGRTVRGMRGPCVRSWTGIDLTKVTLWFKHLGIKYKLTRTAGPNKIILEQEGQRPHQMHQETLDKVLGVSWESFVQVVVLGQFSQFFFDLSPTEKLRHFNDVMQLEIWNTMLERSSLIMKTSENNARVQEGRIQRLKGRVAEIGMETREQYQSRIDRFEYHVRKHQRIVDKLMKKKELTDRVLKKKAERRAELEKRVLHYEANRSPLEDKADDLDKKISELRRELTKFEHSWQASEDHMRSLYNVTTKSKVCFRCKQPILKEYLYAEVKKVRNERRPLLAVRDRIRPLLHDLEVERAKLKDNQKISGDTLLSMKEQLTELRVAAAEVQGRRDVLENQIAENRRLRDQADFSIADERSARNKQRRRKRHIDRLIKKQQFKLDRSNRIISSWKYMQQHFRNIRLWVIDTALAELKTLTNSFMQELGMTGWRAEFAIERESASGGLIKGFSVLIYSPGSPDKAMPWEAFSGGESQRLRIAGTCALSSLLRSRMGVDTSLEVWDEPTQHLSAEGIDDLISFFKARSRKLGMQLWMIDHRSLNHGQFDRRYRVTKTKSGSEITQL